MNIIDKGYAKIFVENKLVKDLDEYLSKHLTGDYYSNPGYLQWNYYLALNHPNTPREWELDDAYCRKLVNRNFIYDFPDYEPEKSGWFVLYEEEFKGELLKQAFRDWRDTVGIGFYPSSQFDSMSDMDALTALDKMRADLIRGQSFIMCSHLNVSLIKKKFSFLEDSFKVITKTTTHEQ